MYMTTLITTYKYKQGYNYGSIPEDVREQCWIHTYMPDTLGNSLVPRPMHESLGMRLTWQLMPQAVTLVALQFFILKQILSTEGFRNVEILLLI